MRTTSNRDLAGQLGVSEAAVRKAAKAGRIGREPDGAWDVDKVRAQWKAGTDPARRKAPEPARPINSEPPQGARAPSPAGMRPVPEAAVGAVRETLREQGEPVPAAGGMTFLQARTANEALKAQTNRIRLQRLKEQLVDRARAIAHVFQLAREQRDAWLNWPARVSAIMASELGVDPHRLHTLLEKHVRHHLDELGKSDFTLR